MTFSDPQVLDAAVYGRIEGQSEFNMIVKSVIHILNLKCNIKIKFIRIQMNIVLKVSSEQPILMLVTIFMIMFLFVLTLY